MCWARKETLHLGVLNMLDHVLEINLHGVFEVRLIGSSTVKVSAQRPWVSLEMWYLSTLGSLKENVLVLSHGELLHCLQSAIVTVYPRSGATTVLQVDFSRCSVLV